MSVRLADKYNDKGRYVKAGGSPLGRDWANTGDPANWSTMWRDFVILRGANDEAERYIFETDSLEIDEQREMVPVALVAAAEAAC